MADHSQEVMTGQRFEFGKNWARFLSVLNNERIVEAEKSLTEMLECADLKHKRFLDAGSGSGLFSLSARRLGAKVHSFDYDPQSVACTMALKRRYYPDDSEWTIEKGSALDIEYMQSLGEFDIVYSWGVLHHTGNLWKALENITLPVRNNGLLYIAIYNDKGFISQFWHRVKKAYCANSFGKIWIPMVFIPIFWLEGLVIDIIKLENPYKRYGEYKKERGMSIFHDWFDWLGGYPYEVAKPEEIFEFYIRQGFSLQKLKTTNSIGNNEYVFKKIS